MLYIILAQVSSLPYDELIKGGLFSAGAVFGGFFCHAIHSLSSKERIERHKLDMKREAQYLEQIKLKDQRIDKLHEKIDSLVKKKT